MKVRDYMNNDIMNFLNIEAKNIITQIMSNGNSKKIHLKNLLRRNTVLQDDVQLNISCHRENEAVQILNAVFTSTISLTSSANTDSLLISIFIRF